MSQIQLVFTVTNANLSAALYLEVTDSSVTVDWGDGNSVPLTRSGGLTHQYSNSGSYSVIITGGSQSSIVSLGDPNTLGGSTFNSVTLTNVTSWGNYSLTSLAFAFANTLNLQSVAAIPSTVTNLSGLFYKASNVNLDLSAWPVSQVTNISYLLQNSTNSNPTVSSWNTLNLVNATSAFYNASAFNQNLATWQVSKVTSMNNMFDYTALSQVTFNSIIQGWSAQSVQSGVTLGAAGLTCNNAGLAAYQSLVNAGWTIVMPMVLVYSITVPNTTVTLNVAVNSGSAASISWGTKFNTTYTVNTSGQVSFTYLQTGTYRVSIAGSMIGFGSATGSGQPNLAGNTNLTQVLSMGNIGMTYCNFIGSSNLASVPDSIPYTLTSIYSMFYNGNSMNDSNVSNWDTTNITNMDSVFYNANQFNRSLANWNTSNVVSMQYLFNGALSFNQPLNGWNTANVTNMQYLFTGASSFNQPLNGWNTANVTNMQGMFAGAGQFNQNIGNWNVANVTNMSAMFQNASAFNQPLSYWNTSVVSNMSYMFQGTGSFNQPINHFNTSNVTDMTAMFQYAPAFNQPLDQWNTTNVTNMGFMFDAASAFNNTVSTWNTSNVTSMYCMLRNTNFNKNISNWNVANVTNMAAMFQNNTAFNQDLSAWNTVNLRDMSYMFLNATAFNSNISGWTTSSLTTLYATFSGASAFNQNLGGWNISGVGSISLDNAGLSVDNFSNTLVGWAAKTKYNVTVAAAGLRYNWAGYAAYNKLRAAPYNWTIAGAASSPIQLTYSPSSSPWLVKLYLGINSAVTVNWGDSTSSNLSTTNLLSHNYSQNGTYTVKIYGQDPSSIYQFGDPGLSAPSNYLTSVGDYGTYFLTSLAGAFSGNTGTLTSLPALPKTVTNISYIFANAQNLNLDLSQWDVSGVTNMSNVFSCASGQLGCYNPNISGWNTKSATTFANMFLNNNAFNQNISGWNVRNVTTMANMLNNCGMSTANFNNLLASWNALSTPTVKSGVALGAQGLVYNGTEAIQAYAGLTSTYSWTITGATSVSSLSQYSGYPFTFTFYQYNPRPTPGKVYGLYDGSSVVSSFVAGADSTVATYSFPSVVLYTGGNHALTIKDASGASVYSTTLNVSFICFKEDTKILCLKYDREEYVPIQKLKKGDLVKTRVSGYVPVDLIGKTRIYNEGTKERIKDQLYVCKKSQYPEVFEDLCITGAHSILVDELTAKQKQKTRALFENVCITEGKYRLMACIDDRAVPYEKPGDYNIYHIALANDDPYSNYGVYANGLLVESCSKRFLLELSNMTILK